jgi:1,4-alpha-glucan branching enzyme
VTGTSEGGTEARNLRSDTPGGTRRKGPGQHQHTHERELYRRVADGPRDRVVPWSLMGELMRPIGDLDLHLFGEGTHRRLWELLGPQPLHVSSEGDVVGARFATWVPDAESVFVVGEWSQWTRESMAPVGVSGIWSIVVPAARTGQRYAFDVAPQGGGGVVRLPDSMAREVERASGGLSMVSTCGLHAWTDDEWMSERPAPADAPERLHHVDLGVLQRRGTDTWDGVATDVLAAAAAADLHHVEVTPTAAHAATTESITQLLPGLFAPIPSLGEPDGFRRFVDTLHRHGVGVVVDWPPIASRADLDQLHHRLGHNEVRNQLMANALYWLEEFHVDGLRTIDVSAGVSPELAAAVRETMAVVSEEFPDAFVIAG